jgi:hypothetical protein
MKTVVPIVPQNTLTKKDLAFRWHVHKRTVEKTIRRFKLVPVALTGIMPLFKVEDVERVEKIRLAAHLKKHHYPHHD